MDKVDVQSRIGVILAHDRGEYKDNSNLLTDIYDGELTASDVEEALKDMEAHPEEWGEDFIQQVREYLRDKLEAETGINPNRVSP